MPYTKNFPETVELCKNEHTNLRHEMNHLRICQMQFLSFGIAGSSMIFGLIFKEAFPLIGSFSGRILLSLFCLIPLCLLLPSLFIFFDKAKTFNRIVGYFYWVEKILCNDVKIKKFFGWENALILFRDNINKNKEETDLSIKNISLTKILFTNRLYWKYSFIFFTILMIICFIPAFLTIIVGIFDPPVETNIFYLFILLIVIISLLTIYSILKNLVIFEQLIDGVFSDKQNKEKWGKIFELNTCPTCGKCEENTTLTDGINGIQWTCGSCTKTFDNK